MLTLTEDGGDRDIDVRVVLDTNQEEGLGDDDIVSLGTVQGVCMYVCVYVYVCVCVMRVCVCVCVCVWLGVNV